MTTIPQSQLRLGGIALIIGGTLLCVALVLICQLSPVDSGSPLDWATRNSVLLAVSYELLAFAMLALAPATVVLHRVLAPSHPARALLACSTLALALVGVLVTVIVEGRLAYPIAGLPPAPTATTAVVSGFFGAFHFALLFLGLALLLLGTIRAGARQVLTLGVGGLLLPASFLWLTPVWLEFAAAAGVLAWALATGVWVLRSVTSPQLSRR
jgi:hypothetical protein